MSSFEKKYEVTGWRGAKYLLTAKQLYERVLEDSKSNYKWITSAKELVRVYNEPDFPEIYAQGIKLIILNCFTNLELKKESPFGGNPTDKAEVYSCRTAKEDEIFEEDDKIYREHLQEFLASIDLKDMNFFM